MTIQTPNVQSELLQNGRIHHHTLLDGERPFTTHREQP